MTGNQSLPWWVFAVSFAWFYVWAILANRLRNKIIEQYADPKPQSNSFKWMYGGGPTARRLRIYYWLFTALGPILFFGIPWAYFALRRALGI